MTIEPNISKEKCEEIRKKEYRNNSDIYRYKYGDVASWFVWKKDSENNLLRFNYDDFTSKLTTKIVFVGLYMYNENLNPPGAPFGGYYPFHNIRENNKLFETFSGTKAEGAYYTDLIKPDKRILDNIPRAFEDRKAVMDIISKNPAILKEHIEIFKQELKDIGADNPLLIAFGDEVEALLKNDFPNIKKIPHFNDDIELDEYKRQVREIIRQVPPSTNEPILKRVHNVLSDLFNEGKFRMGKYNQNSNNIGSSHIKEYKYCWIYITYGDNEGVQFSWQSQRGNRYSEGKEILKKLTKIVNNEYNNKYFVEYDDDNGTAVQGRLWIRGLDYNNTGYSNLNENDCLEIAKFTQRELLNIL